MSWIDRAWCGLIRTLINTFGAARMNQSEGRVFFWNMETTKPGPPLRSGALRPKRVLFSFGFGSVAQRDGRNLAGILMSREQAELFRDTLTESLALQDRQYAIVEEDR